MPTTDTLKLDDYTVAWVCALPLEAAAARAMLDNIHSPPQQIADPNAYEFGELNGHHIVIEHLPNGVYGTVSAAAVVSSYAFDVSPASVRTHGDVVVSKPGGKHGGVIQYDYGKAVQGGQFEPTGILNQPPQVLLTHMSQLEAKQITGEDAILKIVGAVLEQNPNMREIFSPPGQHTDFLFDSYHHADNDSDCEKCDKERLVKRQPRDTRTPYIHYGLIASGDQVMKTRDRLAQQHGILCFEMEAVGLVNEPPTLVVRGICDYCDSHKQKQWQGYAALTAAAYAKLLLSAIPVRQASPSLPKENKPRHWVVSLPRNPKFVGRQDEIRKLEELLTTRDGPRRVAIAGLGGVGKTQVALEVAYRLRDRDKECSVLWVPCTSHALIEQTFLRFAEILGLYGVKPANVKERIKTYLSSERAGKWLLVFDNAHDTEMWLPVNDTAPALEDFLPENVDKGTAFQILGKALEYKNLPENDTTAAALLEQLAFLPLAITQASAYIIENNISLSDYLALLQDQEEDAVNLLSKDFSDPGRYKDIQNPVITTWLISFNQIQSQSQAAADYLSFMACINPRNIPQSLLPSQSTKKQTFDALGLLDAYSFTSSNDTNISIHRLVHIATRNWLKKNDLFSHWIQKVTDRIQEVFPINHYMNRKLWRKYPPHALAVVRENEFIEQQEQYTNLIQKIADCLASDGRFYGAEALYKELLEIDQERNGPEHPSTLTSMANLASTYWDQGRWNEAEKLDIQVMERRKAILGAEHPDTLTSMANLASTYLHQGRWNEAEKLDIQVMEESKKVLGAEHPDTLTSMANLASTYRNLGRWNEAEKLEMKVMKGRKTLLGAEHPDTLTDMANMASTYLHQGRWNEAEQLNIQVMETRKTVLGGKHPSTLTSMANLASTYLHQGRWDKAEQLNIQVMEARKTVLGADHPNTLTSMANLASTYRKQGRWNEAEKLNIQVMETRKRVLGAKHPDTLTSMAKLASIYWNQARWNEAEGLNIQVMETRKRVFGAEHPSTLTSIANLASTYQNQGRWDEAEQLNIQAMEARKIVLGADHPNTLTSMANLASPTGNRDDGMKPRSWRYE
ncbi:hypothetical protein BDW71DRAFT_210570 [Aspergillus fruticulosus]